MQYKSLVGKCLLAIVMIALTYGSHMTANEKSNLNVVASIKPLHSLVSMVMGDVGEPKLILTSNSSPHDYVLRPSDAGLLQEADVIFVISELLETSIVRAAESLAQNATHVHLLETEGLHLRALDSSGKVVPSTSDESKAEDSISEKDHNVAKGNNDNDHAHDHDDHTLFDHHLWLDPENASMMVHEIASVLGAKDPKNATIYSENAAEAEMKLDDLLDEIKLQMEAIGNIPHVVYHDAYRSFQHRFGLRDERLSILEAERAPGARHVQYLRTAVKELKIRCVFAEPQFSDRLVNVVVEGTDARVGILDPLGSIFDAGEDQYIETLRNMANAFADCLTES